MPDPRSYTWPQIFKALEILADYKLHCPPGKEYAKIKECHKTREQNCKQCRIEWALKKAAEQNEILE